MESLSPKRKTNKSLKKPKKINKLFLVRKFLSKTLIFVGLLFIIISLTHRTLRNRSLSFDSNLAQKYTLQTSDLAKTPSHINIEGKINVDIVSVNQYKFEIPETKAAFLNLSAKPEENGNIIIFGHNKKSILGEIRYLKGNEIIILTTNNGSKYMYQIEEMAEVSPSQIKYLEPTKTETLTIYTCSGFFDKNRFIVRAKRVLNFKI